jgi:uncharacterized protein YndB with AHSA1/START domain
LRCCGSSSSAARASKSGWALARNCPRGVAYETASGTAGEVRSFRDLEKIRLTWRPKDWDHDSTLQVTVSAAGANATLRFHQEWLADSEEREEQREYWKNVIERVVAAINER